MIHTSIEVFSGYMLLFWLLQNCYMAIFFQVYPSLNTLSNLCLMFMINAISVMLSYACGREMLLAHGIGFVLFVSAAFVFLFQLLFWITQGPGNAVKGICAAQLLACASLLLVYLIAA